MRVWKYLLKKEFKQFLRDPGMPRMVLCFPFLIILVFPFAANMEVRNLSLVIVDSDQSDQSALLTEKCASSGYFKIREITESPSDAQAVMDRGGADAILTISSGFARYLESDRGTDDPLPVGIKVNTVNGTRGSIGSQYLNAFVTEYVASVSGAESQGGAAGTRFDTRESYLYNPSLDYKAFMIPALIVIAITMMCGFLPALNIVSEKERGTIEQINVTPVGKTAFILCKMIPYVAVAFFMLFSCLGLSYAVFGYGCRGSLLDIVIFTFAHIVVMASFGLLISNYSDNARQAMFVMVLQHGVHADERNIHTHPVDAGMGAGDHLCQSTALLRRRDALDRPEGLHAGGHVAGLAEPCRSGRVHDHLGCPELPQDHLTRLLYHSGPTDSLRLKNGESVRIPLCKLKNYP